jgi:hypothetical protein
MTARARAAPFIVSTAILVACVVVVFVIFV